MLAAPWGMKPFEQSKLTLMLLDAIPWHLKSIEKSHSPSLHSNQYSSACVSFGEKRVRFVGILSENRGLTAEKLISKTLKR